MGQSGVVERITMKRKLIGHLGDDLERVLVIAPHLVVLLSRSYIALGREVNLERSPVT